MDRENYLHNWQQEFISTNLISIGYNAWQGYLSSQRGLIICSTNSPIIGASGETFKVHFVPRNNLVPLLNAWLKAPDTVPLKTHFMNAHILEAVDNYNPEKDVVFMLESGSYVTFFYLTNLPISPPSCYQQVIKIWNEFPSQYSEEYQNNHHL
ncbi:MAG: hypothetical protein O4861_11610 [Trichodesmium sp. St16_bin4-tuft]|nr:hypothetical protein [Trichodesmium sp. St18_bin3_1_1]MDE5098942.1 hypothetical protein [Trichodesmium sp. St16_bin4-tuft]